MADNYLENAREQYEKRKASWLNKKKKLPKTVKREIEKPEDWSL
jgi:hypothetical protein